MEKTIKTKLNITSIETYRYKKFLAETINNLWAADEETEDLEIYDSIRLYAELFNVSKPINMKDPRIQKFLTDILKESLYGVYKK